MNNSPINSTINSTTVVELADASSLRVLDSQRSILEYKLYRYRVPQPNVPVPKTEAGSLPVQNFAIIFS